MEDILRDLFSQEPNRPPRRFRFGTSVEGHSAPLPSALNLADTGQARPLWKLSWKDEVLGLEFEVVEQVGERAGEVWVVVRSHHREHLGRVAKVALVGPNDQMVAVSVALNHELADGGCGGEARVDTLPKLLARFGDVSVSHSHFLVD